MMARNVNEYIAGFPPDVQAVLEEIRATIRKAAPGAEEMISYQMPAFKLKGLLVYFGAFKRHIGFYPTSSGIERFKQELSVYKGAKGSVQFPLDQQMPYTLIDKIVKFRVEENLARDAAQRRGAADEQIKRIYAVFGLPEVPRARDRTVREYLSYLKAHLTCPCVLTGIESLGYFHWEERYSFGYGDEREYERLRRERGSFHDRYELASWKGAKVEGNDIWVQVQRLPHRKRFVLPLSELQAADRQSEAFWLLKDYTVWRVNWH